MKGIVKIKPESEFFVERERGKPIWNKDRAQMTNL